MFNIVEKRVLDRISSLKKVRRNKLVRVLSLMGENSTSQ